MDKNDKVHLHQQLIKLGDMMGDGLHHEPGGKWISREYQKICKTLGYLPKRKRGEATRDTATINEKMAERVSSTDCKKCGGTLQQTRSGSMRAKCLDCGGKFQLLKKVRTPKNG